jgi:hypothetical protein
LRGLKSEMGHWAPLDQPFRGATAVKFLVLALVLPLAALAVVGGLRLNVPAQDDTLESGTPRSLPLVATDSSGNGNHGVNQGGPVMGLPGHRGTAYSFDREGSWIQVPSHEALNPGRNNFMISAWVNFDVSPEVGQTYDILRKGLAFTPTGEFKVEILARGRVKCSAKDSIGHEAWVVNGDGRVADGTWHRIGCALTGSNFSVLVDRTIQTKTVEFGSISNTLPLSIGSKYGQEDLPQGRIDEVVLVIAKGSAAKRDVRSQVQKLRATPPTGQWHLDEPVTAGPSR